MSVTEEEAPECSAEACLFALDEKGSTIFLWLWARVGVLGPRASVKLSTRSLDIAACIPGPGNGSRYSQTHKNSNRNEIITECFHDRLPYKGKTIRFHLLFKHESLYES